MADEKRLDLGLVGNCIKVIMTKADPVEAEQMKICLIQMYNLEENKVVFWTKFMNLLARAYKSTTDPSAKYLLGEAYKLADTNAKVLRWQELGNFKQAYAEQSKAKGQIFDKPDINPSKRDSACWN